MRVRVLGVDLGSRRIGLALSDALGMIAGPHATIARSGDRAVDHSAIVDAAREAGAQRIVVGLPLSLSGALGPAARAALEEVDGLSKRAAAAQPPIAVETYDERFTTVTAHAALADAKVKRRTRKEVVDKVAAAVMLQAYLDAQSDAQADAQQ